MTTLKVGTLAGTIAQFKVGTVEHETITVTFRKDKAFLPCNEKIELVDTVVCSFRTGETTVTANSFCSPDEEKFDLARGMSLAFWRCCIKYDRSYEYNLVVSLIGQQVADTKRLKEKPSCETQEKGIRHFQKYLNSRKRICNDTFTHKRYGNLNRLVETYKKVLPVILEKVEGDLKL